MATTTSINSATTTTHSLTLKTLDQTRLRLFQLTNALSSLHRDLLISDPLPPPSSLQKTSQLLAHHLSSLSSFLASPGVQDTLARTAVYPVPSFGWADAAKEGILTQLLRKKVDPAVGDWVDAAVGEAVDGGGGGVIGGPEGELGLQELEELWTWAKPRAGELAAGIPWGTDFSIAEREAGIENVQTGIRRVLDTGDGDEEDEEDDDDDDDDEDDEDEKDGDSGNKMQGVEKSEVKTKAEEMNEKPIPAPRPMVPLEELLKFISTGAAPRSVELGRGIGPGGGSLR